MKKALTDRTLKALKPAEPGKRYTLWDAIVPSFGVRVTDRGAATFIVMRRLNGKLTRHVIAKVGAKSLADAREAARSAIEDMERGVDPKAKAEAEKRQEARRQAGTFANVAEDFISRHVSTLSTADEVEAAIRREFLPRWGNRPIGDVTRRDVVEFLEGVVDRGTPYAAHHLFAYLRKLYSWAIARDTYGIEFSPCDRIRPAEVIGKREPRQRILTDAEMRLLWAASETVGYPFGHLAKFLLMTGQRRDEAANMAWSEVDFDKGIWSIPAERMKMDAPHVVPLPPEAISFLKEIRTDLDRERLTSRQREADAAMERFGEKTPQHLAALSLAEAERQKPRPAGDFVFTTTDGLKPISGFSKAKGRIDEKMLAIVRKTIEEAGGDPATATVAEWRFHDLRRTARTHFSAIPCQDLVRELAIAHARPGLHAVYDQFAYLDEKRALFEAWAKRLTAIVTPAPENVIRLWQEGAA